jgi:ribosome maturation factor RimP
MSFKEQVQKYLDDYIATREDLFLIDFTIDKNFKIEVVIDGDHGVILQDCIDISRFLNESLEGFEEDFSLDVFSAGVSLPLINKRQYPKNIGRILSVKTNEKDYLAELLAADDKKITITWKSREPKKIGNGKQTVTNTLEIKFEDIKETIVTVTF